MRAGRSVLILVAGGTGTVGTELVRRLVARGSRVRVLSRDPLRHPATANVEIVAGDVRDRRSLERAAADVTTVVSAVHGFLDKDGPRAIDRDGNRNLIAAAHAAGAEHFVLVSIAGASGGSPM